MHKQQLLISPAPPVAVYEVIWALGHVGVVTVCTAVNIPTAVVKAMVVSEVILHYKSGGTKNAAGKSSR